VDRLEDGVGERFGIDVGDHRGAQPVAEREVEEACKRRQREHEIAQERARALQKDAAHARQEQELARLQEGEHDAEKPGELLLSRKAFAVDRKDQELGDAVEDGERQRVQGDQNEKRIADPHPQELQRAGDQGARCGEVVLPIGKLAEIRPRRELHGGNAGEGKHHQQQVGRVDKPRHRAREHAAERPADRDRDADERRGPLELDGVDIRRAGRPEQDLDGDLEDVGAGEDDEVRARDVGGDHQLARPRNRHDRNERDTGDVQLRHAVDD
jgi:hypothetical protein